MVSMNLDFITPSNVSSRVFRISIVFIVLIELNLLIKSVAIESLIGTDETDREIT